MPAKSLASAPERIKIGRAAEITGESERTLQAAAAAGSIPGAAKLFKCWTFDERSLRAWLRGKEQEPCRKKLQSEEADRNARPRTRSAAARRGGLVSRSPAASSEEAYQRAMNALLGNGRGNGMNAK